MKSVTGTYVAAGNKSFENASQFEHHSASCEQDNENLGSFKRGEFN